jgi:hypothetical protein
VWLVVHRVEGELVAQSFGDDEFGLGVVEAASAAGSEIVAIERDARVELEGDFYRNLQ